jgi:outer membrane protein assembly factor BamB
MRYSYFEPLDYSDKPVETSIDLSNFSGLETVASFEVARDLRERMLFRIGVGGSFNSTPVLHDGVLYIGCADKNFYAISSEGKELWRFETDAQILGTARLWEGIIYFGSYDGNMYALDLNGKLVWKYSTNGKIFSCPCISDSRLYFGSNDCNLYCLDARTGRKLWRFAANGPVATSPVCVGGSICFGSDDSNFYSVDKKTGSLLWKFNTAGGIESFHPFHDFPPVYKNTIFFTSWDFNLYSVTLQGRLAWKFACNNLPYLITVYRDRIYFGSRDGHLYCLDAEAGKRLWSFYAEGFIVSQPLIHDNRIYFGSGDSNLYCITLDGKRVWSFATKGPVTGSVVSDNNALYFASWDCNVYAVSRDGRLLWRFPSSLGYQSSIDMESPETRRANHQVIWSREIPEKENHGETTPERVSDYGDRMDEYQSTGISTTYMSGSEKAYKTRRKYG